MISAMANKSAEQHFDGQTVGDDRVVTSDSINRRQKSAANAGAKMCRRVRFTKDEGKSSSVSIVFHPTEPMTEEEFSSYFFQSDDMQRFNKDMEETIRTYVDYRLGKASCFDHDSWTIRGLEEILDHMKCNKTKNVNQRRDSRVDIKAKHKQEVLEEVRRQQQQQKQQQMGGGGKEKHAPLLNADQVRQASLRLSENDANRAVLMARRDAEEVRRIYPESSFAVVCSEEDEIVIMKEQDSCQPKASSLQQLSAKQVPSESCTTSSSSESNCSMEKTPKKNGQRGGRWALSFSRKKTSGGVVGLVT
jgi:hypothetical protein